MSPYTLRNTLVHKVLSVRHLTSSAFVVRMSRNELDFEAGQHLSVGLSHDTNMREYSVYSSTDDDFLEILVKEIPTGAVSPRLKKLKPEQEVSVEGPFGFFTISEEEKSKHIYCVATGTGIAPFHCFTLSYPHLPFTVFHGVRERADCYEHNVFFRSDSRCTYIPCISRRDVKKDNAAKISGAAYEGRVTDYLRTQGIDEDGVYFLCGNCDMIYEVFDILQRTGVTTEQIKAEVYF